MKLGICILLLTINGKVRAKEISINVAQKGKQTSQEKSSQNESYSKKKSEHKS